MDPSYNRDSNKEEEEEDDEEDNTDFNVNSCYGDDIDVEIVSESVRISSDSDISDDSCCEDSDDSQILPQGIPSNLSSILECNKNIDSESEDDEVNNLNEKINQILKQSSVSQNSNSGKEASDKSPVVHSIEGPGCVFEEIIIENSQGGIVDLDGSSFQSQSKIEPSNECRLTFEDSISGSPIKTVTQVRLILPPITRDNFKCNNMTGQLFLNPTKISRIQVESSNKKIPYPETSKSVKSIPIVDLANNVKLSDSNEPGENTKFKNTVLIDASERLGGISKSPKMDEISQQTISKVHSLNNKLYTSAESNNEMNIKLNFSKKVKEAIENVESYSHSDSPSCRSIYEFFQSSCFSCSDEAMCASKGHTLREKEGNIGSSLKKKESSLNINIQPNPPLDFKKDGKTQVSMVGQAKKSEGSLLSHGAKTGVTVDVMMEAVGGYSHREVSPPMTSGISPIMMNVNPFGDVASQGDSSRCCGRSMPSLDSFFSPQEVVDVTSDVEPDCVAQSIEVVAEEQHSYSPTCHTALVCSPDSSVSNLNDKPTSNVIIVDGSTKPFTSEMLSDYSCIVESHVEIIAEEISCESDEGRKTVPSNQHKSVGMSKDPILGCSNILTPVVSAGNKITPPNENICTTIKSTSPKYEVQGREILVGDKSDSTSNNAVVDSSLSPDKSISSSAKILDVCERFSTMEEPADSSGIFNDMIEVTEVEPSVDDACDIEEIVLEKFREHIGPEMDDLSEDSAKEAGEYGMKNSSAYNILCTSTNLLPEEQLVNCVDNAVPILKNREDLSGANNISDNIHCLNLGTKCIVSTSGNKNLNTIVDRSTVDVNGIIPTSSGEILRKANEKSVTSNFSQTANDIPAEIIKLYSNSYNVASDQSKVQNKSPQREDVVDLETVNERTTEDNKEESNFKNSKVVKCVKDISCAIDIINLCNDEVTNSNKELPSQCSFFQSRHDRHPKPALRMSNLNEKTSTVNISSKKCGNMESKPVEHCKDLLKKVSDGQPSLRRNRRSIKMPQKVCVEKVNDNDELVVIADGNSKKCNDIPRMCGNDTDSKRLCDDVVKECVNFPFSDLSLKTVSNVSDLTHHESIPTKEVQEILIVDDGPRKVKKNQMNKTDKFNCGSNKSGNNDSRSEIEIKSMDISIKKSLPQPIVTSKKKCKKGITACKVESTNKLAEGTMSVSLAKEAVIGSKTAAEKITGNLSKKVKEEIGSRGYSEGSLLSPGDATKPILSVITRQEAKVELIDKKLMSIDKKTNNGVTNKGTTKVNVESRILNKSPKGKIGGHSEIIMTNETIKSESLTPVIDGSSENSSDDKQSTNSKIVLENLSTQSETISECVSANVKGKDVVARRKSKRTNKVDYQYSFLTFINHKAVEQKLLSNNYKKDSIEGVKVKLPTNDAKSQMVVNKNATNATINKTSEDANFEKKPIVEITHEKAVQESCEVPDVKKVSKKKSELMSNQKEAVVSCKKVKAGSTTELSDDREINEEKKSFVNKIVNNSFKSLSVGNGKNELNKCGGIRKSNNIDNIPVSSTVIELEDSIPKVEITPPKNNNSFAATDENAEVVNLGTCISESICPKYKGKIETSSTAVQDLNSVSTSVDNKNKEKDDTFCGNSQKLGLEQFDDRSTKTIKNVEKPSKNSKQSVSSKNVKNIIVECVSNQKGSVTDLKNASSSSINESEPNEKLLKTEIRKTNIMFKVPKLTRSTSQQHLYHFISNKHQKNVDSSNVPSSSNGNLEFNNSSDKKELSSTCIDTGKQESSAVGGELSEKIVDPNRTYDFREEQDMEIKKYYQIKRTTRSNSQLFDISDCQPRQMEDEIDNIRNSKCFAVKNKKEKVKMFIEKNPYKNKLAEVYEDTNKEVRKSFRKRPQQKAYENAQKYTDSYAGNLGKVNSETQIKNVDSIIIFNDNKNLVSSSSQQELTSHFPVKNINKKKVSRKNTVSNIHPTMIKKKLNKCFDRRESDQFSNDPREPFPEPQNGVKTNKDIDNKAVVLSKQSDGDKISQIEEVQLFSVSNQEHFSNGKKAITEVEGDYVLENPETFSETNKSELEVKENPGDNKIKDKICINMNLEVSLEGGILSTNNITGQENNSLRKTKKKEGYKLANNVAISSVEMYPLQNNEYSNIYEDSFKTEVQGIRKEANVEREIHFVGEAKTLCENPGKNDPKSGKVIMCESNCAREGYFFSSLTPDETRSNENDEINGLVQQELLPKECKKNSLSIRSSEKKEQDTVINPVKCSENVNVFKKYENCKIDNSNEIISSDSVVELHPISFSKKGILIKQEGASAELQIEIEPKESTAFENVREKCERNDQVLKDYDIMPSVLLKKLPKGCGVIKQSEMQNAIGMLQNECNVIHQKEISQYNKGLDSGFRDIFENSNGPIHQISCDAGNLGYNESFKHCLDNSKIENFNMHLKSNACGKDLPTNSIDSSSHNFDPIKENTPEPDSYVIDKTKGDTNSQNETVVEHQIILKPDEVMVEVKQLELENSGSEKPKDINYSGSERMVDSIHTVELFQNSGELIGAKPESSNCIHSNAKIDLQSVAIQSSIGQTGSGNKSIVTEDVATNILLSGKKLTSDIQIPSKNSRKIKRKNFVPNNKGNKKYKSLHSPESVIQNGNKDNGKEYTCLLNIKEIGPPIGEKEKLLSYSKCHAEYHADNIINEFSQTKINSKDETGVEQKITLNETIVNNKNHGDNFNQMEPGNDICIKADNDPKLSEHQSSTASIFADKAADYPITASFSEVQEKPANDICIQADNDPKLSEHQSTASIFAHKVADYPITASISEVQEKPNNDICIKADNDPKLSEHQSTASIFAHKAADYPITASISEVQEKPNNDICIKADNDPKLSEHQSTASIFAHKAADYPITASISEVQESDCQVVSFVASTSDYTTNKELSGEITGKDIVNTTIVKVADFGNPLEVHNEVVNLVEDMVNAVILKKGNSEEKCVTRFEGGKETSFDELNHQPTLLNCLSCQKDNDDSQPNFIFNSPNNNKVISRANISCESVISCPVASESGRVSLKGSGESHNDAQGYKDASNLKKYNLREVDNDRVISANSNKHQANNSNSNLKLTENDLKNIMLNKNINPLVSLEVLDLKKIQSLMKENILSTCWMPETVHNSLLHKRHKVRLKRNPYRYVAVVNNIKVSSKSYLKVIKNFKTNSNKYDRRKMPVRTKMTISHAKSQLKNQAVKTVLDYNTNHDSVQLNTTEIHSVTSSSDTDHLKIHLQGKKHVHVHGVKNYTYFRYDYVKKKPETGISDIENQTFMDDSTLIGAEMKEREETGVESAQVESGMQFSREKLYASGPLSKNWGSLEEMVVRKPVSLTQFIEQENRQSSESLSKNKCNFPERVAHENNVFESGAKQQQFIMPEMIAAENEFHKQICDSNFESDCVFELNEEPDFNSKLTYDADMDAILMNNLIDRRKVRNTSVGPADPLSKDFFKPTYPHCEESVDIPSTSSTVFRQDPNPNDVLMCNTSVPGSTELDCELLTDLIFRRSGTVNKLPPDPHFEIRHEDKLAKPVGSGIESVKQRLGIDFEVDITDNTIHSSTSDEINCFVPTSSTSSQNPVISTPFFPLLNNDNFNQETLDRCFKEHKPKGNISRLIGVVSKNRTLLQETKKELHQKLEVCKSHVPSDSSGSAWFKSTANQHISTIPEVNTEISPNSLYSPTGDISFDPNKSFSKLSVKKKYTTATPSGNISHENNFEVPTFDDLLDFKGFDFRTCKCPDGSTGSCLKCIIELEVNKIMSINKILKKNEEQSWMLSESNMYEKDLNNYVSLSESRALIVDCSHTYRISNLNIIIPSNSVCNQQVSYCMSKEVANNRISSADIVLNSSRIQKHVKRKLWRKPKRKEERSLNMKKLSFKHFPDYFELTPNEDFNGSSNTEEDERRISSRPEDGEDRIEKLEGSNEMNKIVGPEDETQEIELGHSDPGHTPVRIPPTLSPNSDGVKRKSFSDKDCGLLPLKKRR